MCPDIVISYKDETLEENKEKGLESNGDQKDIRNDGEGSPSDSYETEFSDESEEIKPLPRRIFAYVYGFILSNFLIVVLITALLFGALVPAPGVFMSKLPTSYIAIILIFITNGLRLKTEALKSALSEYRAFLSSLLCILFITPIIGAKLTELLPYGRVSTDILPADSNLTLAPQSSIAEFLGPGEIKIGFQIYFLMPCTIVTCFVLVMQVGGDLILAMLISIVSNLLAVFIVPPMMKWLTSFDADVKLDVVKIITKLVLTVLVPVIVGKIVRRISWVQQKADLHGNTLSLFSVCCLVTIPWMKVSQTSANNTLGLISLSAVGVCIGWAFLMHLIFLLVSVGASLVCCIDRKLFKTLMIPCSQKTLAITLAVIDFLPPNAGDQGLMSLPVILSHLTVVFFDSILLAKVKAYELKKYGAKEEVSIQSSLDVELEEFVNMESAV